MLLFLLGIIVLYLLLAVVLSLIPTQAEPLNGPKSQELYVSSNGVHTDFILPVQVIPERMRKQLGYLADYPYVAFGWGDKGFYLDTPSWAELRASTAIRAMLLPSPTAVHVTGHRAVGAEWGRLPLSQSQVDVLNVYLAETFKRDGSGQIVHIDSPGYGEDDEFYEAVGSYNALYTCNNWVNAGMKRMGVRTALWSPSEWGIMRWLPEHGN